VVTPFVIDSFWGEGPQRVPVVFLGFLRATVEGEGVTFVPEPSVWLLVVFGLAVLALVGRRRRSRASLLVFVLVVASQPAQAASIIYEFSGTVDVVVDYDDAFNDRIQVGDRFQGRLRLDLSAPDLDADPDLGEYDVGSLASLSISIGRVTLQNDPSELFVFHVRNNWRGPEDMAGFSLRNPVASGVPHPLSHDDYYIWMTLLDDDADEFDGDGLPLDLDLSAFETARLDIQSRISGVCAGWSCSIHGFKIHSTIESFHVVPEPSTLLLAAIGLALLAVAYRRVRR
jgi:hypothetical protein